MAYRLRLSQINMFIFKRQSQLSERGLWSVGLGQSVSFSEIIIASSLN